MSLMTRRTILSFVTGLIVIVAYDAFRAKVPGAPLIVSMLAAAVLSGLVFTALDAVLMRYFGKGAESK